jgi:hypothetical protein
MKEESAISFERKGMREILGVDSEVDEGTQKDEILVKILTIGCHKKRGF